MLLIPPWRLLHLREILRLLRTHAVMPTVGSIIPASSPEAGVQGMDILSAQLISEFFHTDKRLLQFGRGVANLKGKSLANKAQRRGKAGQNSATEFFIRHSDSIMFHYTS